MRGKRNIDRNTRKFISIPDTQIRIFGKPNVQDHRRMAVLLARGKDIEEAKEKVNQMYNSLKIEI